MNDWNEEADHTRLLDDETPNILFGMDFKTEEVLFWFIAALTLYAIYQFMPRRGRQGFTACIAAIIAICYVLYKVMTNG